jgi:alpha-1,2-mannosyltransferase
MFCQSLASVLVVLEALSVKLPDIFCDTIGAPFSYPFVKYLTGAKVVAYVHYPIISQVPYL